MGTGDPFPGDKTGSECLDELNDYQLLKQESAPWN
jgi:hypothetical protein